MRLPLRFIPAAVFLAAQYSSHSQFRFEPLVINSNRFQLALLGTNGINYAIESSANLSNWSVVHTAIAVNGRITYEAPLLNTYAQFFRGRPHSTPTNIAIIPLVDSNLNTSAQLTDAGATNSLYASAPGGTVFTLEFPSNMVANPTLIQMTLVTNISGLPFAGPVIGAVKLTSVNPDFLGAATLRISFGTNIDRRRIISFRAATDGSNFGLTPDRVGANAVVIPIGRPGVYGSVIATTQEIAAASPPSRKKSPSSPKKIAISREPFNTAIVCFPDLVAEANAIRSEIETARTQSEQAAAVSIGMERQQQMLGLTDDPTSTFAGAAERSCEFYREHIEPHWPQTQSNCSLTTVLLEAALALEKQMQALGIPDNERCTANVLSADLLCPAFKQCLEEVKICCQAGNRDRQRMIDIATMVRQQALLGIIDSPDCFDLDDPAAEETINACTEVIWTGTIKIKEQGSRFDRYVNPYGYLEETSTFEVNYSGFIAEASENNIPGFGITATLYTDGSFSYRDYQYEYSQVTDNCGTRVFSDRVENVVNSSSVYSVNVGIQATNYSILIGFMGRDRQFTVPGIEFHETVTTAGPGIGCSGMERTTTKTTTDTYNGGPSLVIFTGPMDLSSTNSIQGSTNFTGLHSTLPTKLHFSWNLTRMPTAQ